MGVMSESVPVRCPACRREHRYTAPSYPCVCGAPVAPPLDPYGVPTAVTHRSWDEQWVGVRCASCGHRGQWPQPELGCPCGTTLRIPVTRPAGRAGPVRTARGAVTAAVLYLRRLGHENVRRADRRPPSGIGLAARGLLAHVDPSVHPASLRDVECLWLAAMTESADCVHFSLAGYSAEALEGAVALRVPLFVLTASGGPRPANALAEALDAAAAGAAPPPAEPPERDDPA
ncbi:hypothetical protein [Streptomyces sp. NPDC020996]|uniref:hypothetical protein n=1 Tax=Streptomyces sp. NPDC020996 TaxID=3154791 RepID=UPI0033EB3596